MPVNLRALQDEGLLSFEEESLAGMPDDSVLVGQDAVEYKVPEDGVFKEPSSPAGHVMQGLDKALEIIDEANPLKVLVYFDPDVDGLFAGKMLIDLLLDKGITPRVYINQNRSHGFDMALLPKLKGWTVLNGDFKITEDELKQMVHSGVSVVSLDHHENGRKLLECRKGDHRGIVVNNLFDGEPVEDHFLSGAGVVYKLLEYFDPEKYNTVEYRAMVGITLFSDVRDVQARNSVPFVESLFNYDQNGYLREMSLMAVNGTPDFNHFTYPKFTREFVNFRLNPQLNAMLRLGKEKDVLKYMLRRKGWQDLRLKSFQDKQRKMKDSLKEKAKIKDMGGCVVLLLDSADLDEEEAALFDRFVGFICSSLTGDYKKPAVGLCIENGKVKRGSFRGQVDGYDYRSLIEKEINGMAQVVGHAIAFGVVGLANKDVVKFCKAVNKVCANQPEIDNKPIITTGSTIQDIIEDSYLEKVGIHNAYRTFARKIGVRLTDPHYTVVTEGAKFARYSFDGRMITTYCGATPAEGLFIPTLCGTELTWELVNNE